MRTYAFEGDRALTKVVCNKCGRELNLQSGVMVEDACHVEYKWGYFSDKDLEKHEFDLCEDCYNVIIESFAIPVCITEEKEI